MLNKKIITVVVISFSVLSLSAQVRFIGNYAASGANADALLNTIVVGRSRAAQIGEIELTVTEENSSLPVLTINFPNISILPGNNLVSRFQNNANKTFYSNHLSQVVQNDGYFAPGTYSICWKFVRFLEPRPGLQQCFIDVINPRFPINLITPADSICELRPPFIWQGRKLSTGSQLKVICVEIKENQTEQEAIATNTPIVNEFIGGEVTQLPYPLGSQPLQEGKQYAWQVYEVSENSVLNSSEIYVFDVSCAKDIKKQVLESFAEAKSYSTGKKYYFTNSLNISFINPYSNGILKYAIKEVATNTNIDKLPVININKGLNRLKIPIEKITGLQKDTQYKIEIYGIGPLTHFLNFTVK